MEEYLDIRDGNLSREKKERAQWMDHRECQEHVQGGDPQFCIHPDEYRKVCEHVEQTVSKELSPTWNEDCLAELDDFIESQGIYIRQ